MLVSVVTPCFNEALNVEECYERTKLAMKKIENICDYEHIFCDNSSTDGTVQILRNIAEKDKRVKVVLLNQNIGPVRNIWNGLKNASGDLIIPMLPADMQDPPEIIPEMIETWNHNKGEIDIIYGVRKNRNESFLLESFRKFYYFLIRKFGNVNLPRNAGDFMLLSRVRLNQVLKAENQYPYLRGLVAQTEPRFLMVTYDWLPRKKGKSKNNYWTLLDEAINGIISTSKVPARLALITGILFGLFSLLFTLVNLIVLLLDNNNYGNGIPTIIIGIFMVGGIQLFFLGLVGEYILSLHSEIRKAPPFQEIEKLNFE